ncbi:MAG: thiosulfate/3-mercaptopyruvate sulfurtransferase [Granulosicoccus sp.]|jgi:thiosulfate/3-mercaptopyruvate sulfurtransferase
MSLPLVIDSPALAELLSQVRANGATLSEARICLVDLRSPEAYAAGHIPGAVSGSVALLNRSAPPMGGLMPEPHAVNSLLEQIGANLGDQIIAYDSGKETAAARLMWVLDAYGYEVGSWLSGGITDWVSQELSVTADIPATVTGNLTLSLIGDNVISAELLIENLGSDSLKILDVRSTNEYAGTDVRSARGGHVPGALHMEWTTQLDDKGCLLNDELLHAQLDHAGVSIDDTVIVYCQTHQRSAVTYVALKHLGYNDVRALDGAWSNWGNRTDTPIEQ